LLALKFVISSAVVMTMVLVGINAGPAGASAFEVPPPLLNVIDGGGGLFAATHAQYVALVDFQNQAIENTLQDHGLPQSDYAAVETWGRTDALSELWLMIVNAIKTSACSSTQTPGNGCRTADQQNVAEWVAALYQRNAVLAAEDAGLEYVKWAGLSQSGWANLIASNPAKDDITKFLCGGGTPVICPPQAQPYANEVTNCPTDGSPCATVNNHHYTAGYCVYESPAPFQGDFTESTDPLCISPGTCQGCTAVSPSYDALVKYGAGDVTDKLFNNPAAQDYLTNVAIGAGFGVGAAAAITAISLSASVVSTATVSTVSTASFLFPFAAAVGITVASGAILAVIAVAGAIATGYYAYQLFTQAEIPSQIATLIDNARTKAAPLGDVVGNQSELSGLYALFIGAALPVPDNQVCLGYDAQLNPCLNASPPLPESRANQQFVTSQYFGESADPAYGPQTHTDRIGWKDTKNNVTDSAYAVNNWFVETTTDASSNKTTFQTLRIHYTDWNGNGQTAWLVHYPGQGAEFLSMQDQASGTPPLDVATCMSNNTCQLSSVLYYVGADGNKYATAVLDPTPELGTPLLSASPVEGVPVSLSALAISPIHDPLTVAFAVQDKPLNAPQIFCTPPYDPTTTIPCPNPTFTVTGNPAMVVFPTAGVFTIVAEADDQHGHSGFSSTTVDVASVAPTVNIDGACNITTLGYICLPPYNHTINPPGSTVSLTGNIAHAGREDFESLTIDWGDGSTDAASNAGACQLYGIACNPDLSVGSAAVQGDGSYRSPFGGTHVYSSPGTYTVTVTATNEFGDTSSSTISETAIYPTATSIQDSNPTTVYGQSTTFTATVSPTNGSLSSSPPTGTVNFYDGNSYIGTGTLSTTAGVTTAQYSTAGLAVGSGHTISASYLGDVNYEASASSAASHAVAKAATSTALGSSPVPSVFGQSVTLTATVSVTSPGAGTPTGTVEFKDGSSDITGCASQSVDLTGVATCTVSSLAVASHSVTAIYSGDTNFQSSSSSALSDSVNRASSATLLATSTPNVTLGQPLTITATVTVVAPGAGVPSGTVRFLDGSTVLGTGTLDVTGVATLTTSSLALGKHSLSVSYLGDSSFLASGAGPSTEYVDTSLAKFPKLPSGAYNLAGANLAGTILVGAQLQGASLAHANLLGAVLIGVNLTGANLTGANLQSADLTGANLAGANLSSANLLGANLKGANLTGANMAGANIKGVLWGATTCPDGTSSDAHKGTCAGHL
jgi:hypothetical protein